MAYASQLFGGKKQKKSAAKKRSASKKKSGSKKKSRSRKTGKKGGNPFLTAVGELVFPTGFEQAATTAGLFAVDRLSQRKPKKIPKGGMDMDMNTTTMPPTSMPLKKKPPDLSGGAKELLETSQKSF